MLFYMRMITPATTICNCIALRCASYSIWQNLTMFLPLSVTIPTEHLFSFEGDGDGVVKGYLGSLTDSAECLVE